MYSSPSCIGIMTIWEGIHGDERSQGRNVTAPVDIDNK